MSSQRVARQWASGPRKVALLKAQALHAQTVAEAAVSGFDELS